MVTVGRRSRSVDDTAGGQPSRSLTSRVGIFDVTDVLEIVTLFVPPLQCWVPASPPQAVLALRCVSRRCAEATAHVAEAAFDRDAKSAATVTVDARVEYDCRYQRRKRHPADSTDGDEEGTVVPPALVAALWSWCGRAADLGRASASQAHTLAIGARHTLDGGVALLLDHLLRCPGRYLPRLDRVVIHSALSETTCLRHVSSLASSPRAARLESLRIETGENGHLEWAFTKPSAFWAAFPGLQELVVAEPYPFIVLPTTVLALRRMTLLERICVSVASECSPCPTLSDCTAFATALAESSPMLRIVTIEIPTVETANAELGLRFVEPFLVPEKVPCLRHFELRAGGAAEAYHRHSGGVLAARLLAVRPVLNGHVSCFGSGPSLESLLNIKPPWLSTATRLSCKDFSDNDRDRGGLFTQLVSAAPALVELTVRPPSAARGLWLAGATWPIAQLTQLAHLDIGEPPMDENSGELSPSAMQLLEVLAAGPVGASLLRVAFLPQHLMATLFPAMSASSATGGRYGSFCDRGEGMGIV